LGEDSKRRIILTEETTAQITARGRTTGQVRCMNCLQRITPPKGAKSAKCPNCGFEWRISWLWPDVPRVRGPVWDVNLQKTEEIIAKAKTGKGKK